MEYVKKFVFAQPLVTIPLWYAVYCFICLLTLNTLANGDRWVLPTLQGSGLQCSSCGAPGDSNREKCLDQCLDIEDVEMGFLTGPAFSLSTLAVSVPLGLVADRFSRIRLLLFGFLLMSAATLGSGFINEFWQLALCCIIFGAGQSTVNPTLYPLLSDYFSPAYRSTILSVAAAMVFLGQDLAYAGGIISQALSWRYVFWILGIAGLGLIVPFFLTLWEPQRGRSEEIESSDGNNSTTQIPYNKNSDDIIIEGSIDSIGPEKEEIKVVEETDLKITKVLKRIYLFTEDEIKNANAGIVGQLKFIFTNVAFILLWISAALRFIGGFALGAWNFSFYRRVYNLSPTEISIWMAVVVTCGGLLGSTLGPLVADVWKKYNIAANAWICVVSALAGAPLQAFSLLSPNATSSFILLFFAYCFAEIWFGPAVAIAQDIVVPKVRSLSSSIYFVSLSIGGISPMLVGWLNELFNKQAPYKEDSENGDLENVYDPRYSMICVVCGAYVLSAFTFALTGVVMTRKYNRLSAEQATS